MTILLKSTYRLIFGQEKCSIRTVIGQRHGIRLSQIISSLCKAYKINFDLTCVKAGLGLLALSSCNVIKTSRSFSKLTTTRRLFIWTRTGRL